MNKMTDPAIDEEELLRREIATNELIVEFKLLNKKAQKRAIEDKLTQYYKKLIDNEMHDEFMPAAQPMLKTVGELKDICDNIDDSKNGKHSHCFFTINCKPEVGKEEFLEGFDQFVRTFLDSCTYTKKNYIYSVEQRSEGDEEMHGMHCHVLFEKYSNSPSKIQRAFKNKFYDNWVGSPAALDYRYGSGMDFFIEKEKYIKGEKVKEKMEKVKKDRILKTAHRLPWWASRFGDDFHLEMGN